MKNKAINEVFHITISLRLSVTGMFPAVNYKSFRCIEVVYGWSVKAS